MSSVNHMIRSLNSQVWHKMENIADTHPNISRLLAIPISIGTLIRNTLVVPARCIEEAIFVGKSIKVYRNESNPNFLSERRSHIEWHSVQAVKCLILTPLSPLMGIIGAIIILAKVIINPFKTAKINVAKQNFDFFLEESQYSSFKTRTDFANELEFCKAAWNRFEKQVLEAKSHEQVRALHFLDTEDSKTQVRKEIELKQVKFKQAKTIYMENLGERSKPSENIKSLNQIVELDKAWKEFQTLLINTSYAEVSELKFAVPSN